MTKAIYSYFLLQYYCRSRGKVLGFRSPPAVNPNTTRIHMDIIQVTARQKEHHIIYICNATQLPYVNLAQMERMFPSAPKTSLRRVLKGVPKELSKKAKIKTAGGLQEVPLYPAKVVSRLAIKFDIELAEKMLDAGATVYLYGLAGYEVRATRESIEKQAVLDFCAQLEARRWNLEFTPEFYSHLQRLAKLSAPRSSRVAQLTKELVYDKLPDGLYGRLASYRIEDPHQKLHQFLTENGGLPLLRDHMQMLLVLMRSSTDLKDLRQRINASSYGQYQLRLMVS